MIARRDGARTVGGVIAAAVAGLFILAQSVTGSPNLDIRIMARETAPGEPVRIVVASESGLSSVEGTFLEQALHFSPAAKTAEGALWTAWAVIGLDHDPGLEVVRLTAVTSDGKVVPGTHAVTIGEKAFPEELLQVAPKYVKPPEEVQERLRREREKLSAIYASRGPEIRVDGSFVRPVPGSPTSTYGTRRLFNNVPKSPHPGLDLRASTGTPVKSSGPGTVALAEDLYYSGLTVIIDHGGGLVTLYAHLSRIDVEPGDSVQTGEIVGLSGATGRVTGPHLHWGAKVGNRHFDPMALLDPALFKIE